MTILQGGSAYTGTITCTNEAALTLAAIAAAVAGATYEGGCQCYMDRRLVLVNSPLTLTNEQLTIDAAITNQNNDVILQADATSTLTFTGCQIRFQLANSATNSWHQWIGTNTDTNHPALTFDNCHFYLGDGTKGAFMRAYNGSATRIIRNCTFIGGSSAGTGRIGGASSVMDDCLFVGGASMSQFGAILSFARNVVRNSLDGYVWNTSVSGNNLVDELECTGLTGQTVSVSPRVAGTRTFQARSFNSNLGRTVSVNAGSAGQIANVDWEQVLQSSVKDQSNGNPLSGVTRRVWTASGTLLNQADSDGSGNYTDLVVVAARHVCETGAASFSNFGPFPIRYQKYGFLPVEDSAPLDDDRVDAISSVPDTSLVADLSTANAYTVMTANFAAKTYSWTGTGTPQQGHDKITALYHSDAVADVQTSTKATALAGTSFEAQAGWTGTVSGTMQAAARGWSGTLTVTGTGSVAATISGAWTFQTGATFAGSYTIGSGSTGIFASDAQAAGGSVDVSGILSLGNCTGTQGAGTIRASGLVRVTANASAGQLDLRGHTLIDGYQVENTSGSLLTVLLRIGQALPFEIETSGTIAVVQAAVLSFPNIISGSRAQLYNVTQDAEISNEAVGSGGYSRSLTASDYNLGDTIRYRFTYQSGTSARNEVFGEVVMQAADQTVTATQAVDPIYAAAGIDGSTVTECVFDNPNLQIDIDDPDNTTTVQRIGAWYHYYITTADGIANLFGCLDWTQLNLLEVDTGMCDLKIQNVDLVNALVITGGLIRRSDGTSFVDTSGGFIEPRPDFVYDSNLDAVVTGGQTHQQVLAALLAVANKLDTTVEVDGAGPAYQFTAAALDQSPSGGGSAPTAEENATAVRAELATELARIDVATSTRLATAGYTAPLDATATQAAAAAALTAYDPATGAEVAAVQTAIDAVQTAVDGVQTTVDGHTANIGLIPAAL